MTGYKKIIFNVLIISGNTLTLVGCLCIFFGLIGMADLDFFSFGLSSGIRVVGTGAIAGCLLSAIGYSSIDFFDKQ